MARTIVIARISRIRQYCQSGEAPTRTRLTAIDIISAHLFRASRSSAAADDAAPRSTAEQRISESMPRQLDSSTNLTKDRELSVVVTSKLVTDC